jgi:hypothetical protein
VGTVHIWLSGLVEIQYERDDERNAVVHSASMEIGVYEDRTFSYEHKLDYMYGYSVQLYSI